MSDGTVMKLSDLLIHDNIVIQCHDNPDADTLASGFGLYLYFTEKGKQVRFVYSGKYKIQKSNLVLMLQELEIPIEYVETIKKPELLITVDCQYGQGNVTKFDAEKVAVIDHHQIGGELPEFNVVRSNLGSCSTVVRELLLAEGIDFNYNKKLSTALYYGLMTDTNNFAEIAHPLDKDMRDDALIERSTITRFRNANLSLQEMEIAGNALLNYEYNESYRYAVVEAAPCDPNILGMISDLMLEVDAVDTCLVFSVLPFGVKISVRSCVKEVKASELADFITKGIGSGGGHLEKAGGFIQQELILPECQKKGYPMTKEGIEKLLIYRMTDYFDDIEIIHSDCYLADLSDMKLYKKKRLTLGYVVATEIMPEGSNGLIRTLEGDLDVDIQKDIYIMIGIKGEVYPTMKEKFEMGYKRLDTPYRFRGEYEPVIRDNVEGHNISLIPYAKSCFSTGESCIYVKQLDHRVKVFTPWDEEKYMLGKEGDYLAVRENDLHDVYIIEQSIFAETYEKVEA